MQPLKHFRRKWKMNLAGSVLISERGIYAASPFKAIRALKWAEARAPVKSEHEFRFDFCRGCWKILASPK
jgi:hypothetical protein